MANWTDPQPGNDYALVLTQIKDRDVDALSMLLNAPVNPPTGAIKLVRAPVKLQEWSGAAWTDRPIAVEGGGTGGTTQSTARTGLGLGTMSLQNSGAVAITGGSITGVVLNAGALTGALPAVSGAALTNLNASQLASGIVPDARLSGNVPLLAASSNWFAGYLRASGNATNPAFNVYDAAHVAAAGFYGSGRDIHFSTDDLTWMSHFSYRSGDAALGIFFWDRIAYLIDTLPLITAATTHNLAITSRANIYRIAASIAADVTGIQRVSALNLDNGVSFRFFNATGVGITLKHNNVGSILGNRFLCDGAVDFVMGPYKWATITYSIPDNAWLVGA